MVLEIACLHVYECDYNRKRFIFRYDKQDVSFAKRSILKNEESVWLWLSCWQHYGGTRLWYVSLYCYLLFYISYCQRRLERLSTVVHSFNETWNSVSIALLNWPFAKISAYFHRKFMTSVKSLLFSDDNPCVRLFYWCYQLQAQKPSLWWTYETDFDAWFL